MRSALDGKVARVVYFKREARYAVLDDFPCMGAWESVLVSSKVLGPFVSEPEVSKKGDEYEESVLRRVISDEDFPQRFEDVSLIRYGLRGNSRDYNSSIFRKVDSERISRIRDGVLGKIRAFDVSEEGIKDSYEFHGGKLLKGRGDGCLFELIYSDGVEVGYGAFEKIGEAPYVSLRALGCLEDVRRLVKSTGIRELGGCFSVSDNICALVDCKRIGLAYDFSLDDLDMDSLPGNVVL